MTEREWLPPDALVGPAIARPLEAAVADWSRGWFGPRADLRLGALEARPPLWAAGIAATWHVHAGAIAIAVPPSGAGLIRRKALDLRAAPAAETPGDRLLLRALHLRLLADLAERCEAALGMPAVRRDSPDAVDNPWSAGEALWACVGDSTGTEAVRMAIPAAAAVRARKAAIAPSPVRAGLLGERAESLGSVRVAVEARLGATEIALEDLRGLEPGDVLVLDRGVDSPADLLAADCATPFAAARVRGGERVTLTIEP